MKNKMKKMVALLCAAVLLASTPLSAFAGPEGQNANGENAAAVTQAAVTSDKTAANETSSDKELQQETTPKDKEDDDKLNSQGQNKNTASEESGKKPMIKMAPPTASQVNAEIVSISTQLASGAERISSDEQADHYTWNVNPSTDQYKEGHQFTFRVNYAIKGESVPKDTLEFHLPKSILKDRNGSFADTMQWSVPSKAEVDDATQRDGSIDENKISATTFLAYKESDDESEYIVYNFRDLEDSQKNGYFELSYSTTQNTFSYVDETDMSPFTCRMVLGDGDTPEKEESAKPILLDINTSAAVVATEVVKPTNRLSSWDNSWGNAVKPKSGETDESGQYYYAIWSIKSVISATQPYDFQLDPTNLTSEPEGMEIIGYRYAGENVFTEAHQVTNQTNRGDRWDYVLVRIPKGKKFEGTESEPVTKWKSTLSVTAKVTPRDRKDDDQNDPITTKQGKADWVWTKPYFIEPQGNFNAYKRGDGGYRTYNGNIFYLTDHNADSADFSAGQFSRYDLEKFNGFNGAEKELETYDGLDFGSWVYGMPGNLTAEKSDEPGKYWKKKVRYVLTDENLFLLNDDSALISGNASSERTIANGGVADSAQAIRLTDGDFRLKKISFTTFYRDAVFNEDSKSFSGKAPDFGENEALTFYGKTDGGEWTEIGQYNLSSKEWTGVENGSADFSSKDRYQTLTFKSTVNYTAYKVETENTHYYTEIFTVPEYELLSSNRVIQLLDGKSSFILLNNNDAKLYTADENNAKGQNGPYFDVHKSDTDYACASRRESSFTKNVLTASNNPKRRYYTITWKLSERETVTSGRTGEKSQLPQKGGTFYDLLPEGSIYVRNSLQVQDAESEPLSSNQYTVKTIDNYKNTGRTMLVVSIDTTHDAFDVIFDTRHNWESINDFGRTVYNPTAYRTGNESITSGVADDAAEKPLVSGQEVKNLQEDVDAMTNLGKKTETGQLTGNRFLYAQNRWDIAALINASNGLSKKAKSSDDLDYQKSTDVTVGENYSYQLRYMDSQTNKAANVVLYDSLENYEPNPSEDSEAPAAWKGTLTGIGVSQLKKIGINPKAYVHIPAAGEKENSNLKFSYNADDTNFDLSNSAIWTEVKDDTDLSKATAVAIDLSQGKDGKPFIFNPDDEEKKDKLSASVVLYMKAPDNSPEIVNNVIPARYNEVYAKASLYSNDETDPTTLPQSVLNQKYTKVRLKVAKDFTLYKQNSETDKPISGVTFRITGKSAYGTTVDKTETSASDGHITFEKLEMGTYTLQETDATDDYILDPTEHKVEVTSNGQVLYDGQTVPDANQTSDEHRGWPVIKNRPRIHADISLIKARTKTEDNDALVRVSGATFDLSGTSFYGTQVDQKETSDHNGDVKFANIERGTYTLKEINANPDYILNSEEYQVEINENGKVSYFQHDSTENGKWTPYTEIYDGVPVIYNQSKYWDFSFLKVDAEILSRGLEGAVFTLSGSNILADGHTGENETAKEDNGNMILQSKSNKNGRVHFTHLEAGRYILREIKAPTNVNGSGQYEVDENGKPTGTLSYSRDESEYYVDITETGSFTIKKADENEAELTKDRSGSYLFPNERALNGQITIIKKWNDGLSDSERPNPQIHLKRTEQGQTIKGINITVEWRNDAMTSRPSSEGGLTIHLLNKETNKEEKLSKVSKANGNLWTYSFSDILTPQDHYVVYETGSEADGALPDGYTGSALGQSHAISVNSGRATIVNTYKLTYDFDYTGKVQTFTAPMDGEYKLEAWGAQGGGIDKTKPPKQSQNAVEVGGKGGYISGFVYLKKGTTLYVHVGGTTSTGQGGWNGGGTNPANANLQYGGGGATDFSLFNGTDDVHFHSRILTAGGGGGALFYPSPNEAGHTEGGAGGGDENDNGNGEGGKGQDPGFAGTQFAGGAIKSTTTGAKPGKFGLGGQASWNGEQIGQGGAGWYGGGAGGGSGRNGSGAGGSNHAYTIKDTEFVNSNEDYKENCKNLGNKYYVSNIVTKRGEREGAGAARVTLTSVGSSESGSSADQGSQTQTEYSNKEGYVTNKDLGDPDGWKSLGNNIWAYKLNVFDDNATYEIWEDPLDGYTTSFDESVVKGENISTVDCSQNKEITVTNSKGGQFGSLVVSKKVTEDGQEITNSTQLFDFTVKLSGDGIEKLAGNNSQVRIGDRFFNYDANAKAASVTIQLHGGESRTFTNLPAGTTYTVTETPVVNYNGYEQGQDVPSQTAIYERSGQITADAVAEAAFTNTFERPSISRTNVTLKKVVTGTTGGTDNAEYPFTAYFTNLEPNMDYKVLQDGSNLPLTLHSSETGTAYITFNLRKDQTIEFEGLPAKDKEKKQEGATYQFTENAGDWVPSYTVTNKGTGTIVKAADDGITKKNTQLSTATETAESGENTTVTFSNHIERTQTLTLVTHTEFKKVGKESAIDDSPQDEFTYSLSFSGLPNGTVIKNATVGNITPDEHGEAVKAFKLKAGGQIVFTDIPAGVEYTITQEKDEGTQKTDTSDTEKQSGHRGFTAHYTIKTYDFSNSEVAPRSDSSPRIAKVSDKAAERDAELSTQVETVDEGYNDKVEFINKRYDQALPNTGGEGTRLYVFMTIILAGAFVAFTAATRQKKQHR